MRSFLKHIKAIDLKVSPTAKSRHKSPVYFILTPLSVAIAGLTLFAGRADASIAINKSFTPISVSVNQPSVLTIDLFNANLTPANNVTFSDNLPAGLLVAPSPNITSTCGGTITANSGTGVITLTNGTIAQSVGGVTGQCQISVSVIATSPDTYVNQIPASAASSSQGTNPLAANATLTVAPAAPVTGNKVFSPANLHGNGSPTTMTITLNNPNPFLLTNATLTDPLPAGLQVASTPTASTTCAGGTVTAVAGSTSVGLSGGSIPISGSCTVTVRIEASSPNNSQDADVTNVIPVSNLITDEGVTNATTIQGAVRVQTGARVAKAFGPATIIPGGNSVLTLTLSNFNSTPISAADITDLMPAGITVTSLVSNTCGGTPTFTATQVQLTGGTIPAAPSGTGAGTCQIQVNVTSAAAGVYNNTIPAGTFGSVNYPGTNANLTVNLVSVSKSFSPNNVVQGGQTALTITLVNAATSAASITSFTDLLTTMGAGFTVAASPAATTTCGGTVTATPGSTSITKNDGVIPASGSCTIVVPVAVAINSLINSRTNTIAVNGLQTSAGNNTAPATANLTVQRAVALAKAFSPSTVLAGGVSRLTITISRPAAGPLLTGINVTDPLPTGHTVNTTPNMTNTCGGTVSAAAGTSSISLAGGNLNTTSCLISVDIRVPGTTGSATNTIPSNSIVTDQGATYNQAATATLTRINSYLTLNKAFSPTSISLGGSSIVSVLIANNNPNSVNLTNVALTDVFPEGMTIASIPSPSFTGSGCSGGTITATPGSGQLLISGASISAGSICTLSARVTSSFTGNLTNEIQIATATSTQSVTNTNRPSATLTLLGLGDIQVVGKDDGVTSLTPGATTIYAIVVRNNGPDNIAGINVTDVAPAGMTITSWSCNATAGSACSEVSGTGNINTTISLANQGVANFSVNATIAANATGPITNTAQVTLPPVVTDPDPNNNSAQDTNTIASASNSNILLVKRITAINGDRTQNPNDSTPLNAFVDDTTSSRAADDNNSNWLPNYLRGAINAGTVKPGDEIEYTIYFLNPGNANANSVRLCDRIRPSQAFKPDTYGAGSGVQVQVGTSPLINLTNANDSSDRTEFIAAGGGVPANCNITGANTAGTVVVDLTGPVGTGDPALTAIPGSTAAGSPNDAYGFFRFTTQVNR